VVLLEALVALVILATAGATIVTMVAESAHAVHRVREAEGEMRRANAFLSAVSLWSREDLDRHLGDRAQGVWLMRVDRQTPTLYVTTLTDTATHRELLRTSLFRPEAPRAAP
jgi:Cys-tRNA synthase (O-phospho-L-seryl-tRNA:Cys-tRNA synthase)